MYAENSKNHTKKATKLVSQFTLVAGYNIKKKNQLNIYIIATKFGNLN